MSSHDVQETAHARLRRDKAPALAAWLIGYAARRTPGTLATRLEEEWLADLIARRGRLAQLQLAIGCCWASTTIAREFPATQLAAAPANVRQSNLILHLPPASALSRRMIALAVIACLHLAVFYALSSGLVSSVISPAPSIRASFVPEPRTREAPPTTPQPSLITGHIDIQPPEIQLVSPSDPHAGDALAADAHIVSAAPPHVVNRVPGGPAAGFPATDDYYPPAARRLGEQGAATVQVCVDPSGKLSTVPTLALSSGSPRLDLGAIRLASAGSGHYRAATEDGRAVSGCFPLRVRFQLSN